MIKTDDACMYLDLGVMDTITKVSAVVPWLGFFRSTSLSVRWMLNWVTLIKDSINKLVTEKGKKILKVFKKELLLLAKDTNRLTKKRERKTVFLCSSPKFQNSMKRRQEIWPTHHPPFDSDGVRSAWLVEEVWNTTPNHCVSPVTPTCL
jgi:hypothetical protein